MAEVAEPGRALACPGASYQATAGRGRRPQDPATRDAGTRPGANGCVPAAAGQRNVKKTLTTGDRQRYLDVIESESGTDDPVAVKVGDAARRLIEASSRNGLAAGGPWRRTRPGRRRRPASGPRSAWPRRRLVLMDRDGYRTAARSQPGRPEEPVQRPAARRDVASYLGPWSKVPLEREATRRRDQGGRPARAGRTWSGFGRDQTATFADGRVHTYEVCSIRSPGWPTRSPPTALSRR